jgi:hypothetical protein
MTAQTISKSPYRDDSPEVTVVSDWLAANGIDELLPDQPTFVVGHGRIIYGGFKFEDDERGYDTDKILSDGIATVLREDRIVPLVSELTDEVRAAFAALEDRDKWRCFLLERGSYGGWDSRKVDDYRERLGFDVEADRLRRARAEARAGLRYPRSEGQ